MSKIRILFYDVGVDLVELERDFKTHFPGRPLPYPPRELSEIAKFLDVSGHDRRKVLRYEMRSLAFTTLLGIETQWTTTPGRIRSIIDQKVISPIDKLLDGIDEIQTIGAEAAYALANKKANMVNVDRLRTDLEKFRAWSSDALAETYLPSVTKGKTEIKQTFVDALFMIYNSYSNKIPTRSPQSDQKGRWYNDGEFSRFVELCAQPLFPKSTNFDRQIRESQNSHRNWLEAGQKPAK